VRVPGEAAIAESLRRLKAASGSHSPSVSELERALPGVVRVDACFLSNPYATDVAMRRLRAIEPRELERMVCHYPSQSNAVSARLAPAIGVPEEQLVVTNGACEVIAALLARSREPMVVSVPTFSAYYEFARGPIIAHQLDPEEAFQLDLADMRALVARHRPDTVVVINPNNPDGGLVDHGALVDFVSWTQGRVRQVIVDESFAAFTTLEPPRSLAPLVRTCPHLVVVNSLSKSHGIAGLRLGYAVANPLRVRQLRCGALWNLNAFAEWFCDLLADPSYLREYEGARRRYVREARQLFEGLSQLSRVRMFPTAANFALLELNRPASAIASSMLARHGVYVRDCADKRGLEGDRYLRVAARSRPENDRVLAAFADVLADPPHPRLIATSLPNRPMIGGPHVRPPDEVVDGSAVGERNRSSAGARG
jgi:histidinol-phosphate/aromatic aminotransferase/cobyric acid decarboxylase-like protein